MVSQRRHDAGFAPILALSMPKSLILSLKGSRFRSHALELAE
jgi:hypothetical protein